MTTDEKIGIIRMWSNFEIDTHPKFGMMFGRVSYDKGSLHCRHTEMRHDIKAVVDEAYWMVYHHVYAELDYI
jgi:hypothetical protein